VFGQGRANAAYGGPSGIIGKGADGGQTAGRVIGGGGVRELDAVERWEEGSFAFVVDQVVLTARLMGGLVLVRLKKVGGMMRTDHCAGLEGPVCGIECFDRGLEGGIQKKK
jgi:hypothetical protein